MFLPQEEKDKIKKTRVLNSGKIVADGNGAIQKKMCENGKNVRENGRKCRNGNELTQINLFATLRPPKMEGDVTLNQDLCMEIASFKNKKWVDPLTISDQKF